MKYLIGFIYILVFSIGIIRMNDITITINYLLTISLTLGFIEFGKDMAKKYTGERK